MNASPKLVRLAALSSAFTPAAPINDAKLFAERPDQVMACVNALFQSGLHVALFGERGVGKTSLAKVLPKLIVGSNVPELRAVRVDCNSNDSFRSIWRKIFRELALPDPEPPDSISDQFSSAPDPEDVRYRLGRMTGHTLIVIDEFDRVEDDEALSLLADTVKSLSDSAVEVTLMFVGVANTVESLLGEHESIGRSIVQVPVPRMSDGELSSILYRGYAAADLDLDEAARLRIVSAAEGLPHFVHLLGLYAGQATVQDDRDRVDERDVERAEEQAVTQHSIRSEYDTATTSPQKGHLFEEVLLACAYTPKSEFGYFRPGNVREPLSIILDRPGLKVGNYARHLNEMAKASRGPALNKDGEARSYIYRFRNPLLQPFVKIVGRTKGQLTPDMEAKLAQISGHPKPHSPDPPTLFGEVP